MKKPKNPLVDLREELEFVGLEHNEINDCLEKYKKTFAYQFYLLKKYWYEFIQSIVGGSKK